MRKIIVIAGLFLIGFLVYNYIYQDHRNIESETAEYSLSATAIASEFAKNPNAAQQKYLNKTVVIFGAISAMDTTQITIDAVVFCQLETAVDRGLKLHSKIKVKGRVIGFDDLLGEVKLDQCIIN